MKIYSASIAQLDALALLFDAYRVFYRKKSDVKGAKDFLKARIEQKQSVILWLKWTENQ